jgi:hypothetical protein
VTNSQVNGRVHALSYVGVIGMHPQFTSASRRLSAHLHVEETLRISAPDDKIRHVIYLYPQRSRLFPERIGITTKG